MRCVMVMFDSLNRLRLQPYGCDQSITPNFTRLAQRSVQFDTCYAGSLPCMPARRELHTGRYNFLHRCWGPMEPYDVSMPALLKQNGVHSHLVSDHTHYWEEGGATYHTRYSTWENHRGQEGDPWKGVVGGVDMPENLIHFKGYRGQLYRQDGVNRSYLLDERDHPQTRTFDSGLEFIRTNADKDRWFVQIETFDPHEPFFSYERYKALYPHDYHGPQFDWPDYAPVDQSPDEVEHLRKEYLALLSMCDASLGRVLDAFDELDLWKDTLLIVCTDHGYLLGEHGYWAKNYMPPYEEISHTPLFIYDPRVKAAGVRRSALAQTIDLPATILAFFGLPIPPEMQGRDLLPVLRDDTPVRDAALFGIHGAHVCVTDGKRVYMRAPSPDAPLYNYTLMPVHAVMPFSPDELKTMEKAPPFSFTNGCPVMRFAMSPYMTFVDKMTKPNDLLFDLKADPMQEHPIVDPTPEQTGGLERLLVEMMRENDAPKELYARLRLREK